MTENQEHVRRVVSARMPGYHGWLEEMEGMMKEMAEMYVVLIDGVPWRDSKGNDMWDLNEASVIADYLESRYKMLVTVVKVRKGEA